jgi:outer membrane autotransporter protein
MRVRSSVEALYFAVAKTRTFRTVIVALALTGIATEGHAQQPDAPVNIPLQYFNGAEKLAIYVGINDGDPKPYIFDTGSPVFNAVYNHEWWPGLPPNSATNNAPSSTVLSPGSPDVAAGTPLNNAQLCLDGGTPTFCRGYTGNLVEVPSLSFYEPLSELLNPPPVATLEASPGYVVNAAYNYGEGGGTNIKIPFERPVLDEIFYGTFGAGNFATNVKVVPASLNPADGSFSNYWAGGVLGQTMVSGANQGYVVAANGQINPVSSKNPPRQVNGITVTIGGKKKPVTPCSPCVTVGLTPEMLGQFWAATPTDGGNAGVIPWAVLGPPFQNPYDPNSDGNPASTERGTIYETSLAPEGDESSVITETLPGLLDSGTPTLNLETTASLEQAEQVSTECFVSTTDTSDFACTVKKGAELKIAGASPEGQPIPGLPTTTMTLTDNASPDLTYNTNLNTSRNTIGISFFLQNSVLYDLTNQVIGYTPFFVTDAPLATTAGGPLIVDGDNVPLGLAGVISGAGGVTIRKGGAVQLSAENTYTGPTQVSADAKLFVSGPGSIETSSGVHNDGHFDISRAWSPVSIQNLTGSGKTYLGGQNLIITNASGTFSGTISYKHFEGTLYDGTNYLGFPGTGGGLTLAGGTLTLSGANTYSGPTWVNQGALIVNGSIESRVLVDFGGRLGGSGSVGPTAIGYGGVLAPGNSIGTMTVNGDLMLNPGALYQVEANAQGQSDKVIVKGAVNLTGATLLVLEAAGAYKPKTDYVIIDNDGTDAVTGEFDQVLNTLAFLIPSVTYDGGSGNDVVLTLERNSSLFKDVAKTRNHRAVAGALDKFPTDDLLFFTVLNQTEEGARQAFDALSGEIHATVAGTLVDDSRYAREAVMGRMMQASHTNGALAANGPQLASHHSQAMMLGGADAYDGKSLVQVPQSQPLSFWTEGYGAFGWFGGDGNAVKADRNLGGFISGMDAHVGGSWRVGLATGASFSDVSVDKRYSGANTKTYHLGGYVGGEVGGFALRGGGLWAWTDIETSRAVAFPNFYERQKADYDADTGQLFGEIAYPTQMGGVELEPFAGLAFVSVESGGFHERGGAQASLRTSGFDQDVGYTTVGLRAAQTMMWGAMAVTPHIEAAWLHAFDDVTPGASLAFATTGIGFAVDGVPRAEDSAILDAGLDFAISERLTAGASFTAQYAEKFSDNGVKGRFTWLF